MEVVDTGFFIRISSLGNAEIRSHITLRKFPLQPVLQNTLCQRQKLLFRFFGGMRCFHEKIGDLMKKL